MMFPSKVSSLICNLYCSGLMLRKPKVHEASSLQVLHLEEVQFYGRGSSENAYHHLQLPPFRVDLLHQLLEGQVLVLVGVQTGLAYVPQNITEALSATQFSAENKRVTKNPIKPSISARLRLAIGVPTTTSHWPV